MARQVRSIKKGTVKLTRRPRLGAHDDIVAVLLYSRVGNSTKPCRRLACDCDRDKAANEKEIPKTFGPGTTTTGPAMQLTRQGSLQATYTYPSSLY